MSTTWWGVLTVAVIVIVGVWLYAASNSSNSPIGGQTDEHGCLVAAGYSWDADQQECVRAWEEEDKAEAEVALQKLLADKYDKSLDTVAVRIDKIDGDYVSGTVQFDTATTGASNSGQVLAYKNGNDWQLVYDGNGSVDCDELRDVGFSEMILRPNFCEAGR